MVGVFREKGQKLRKRDPYLDFGFSLRLHTGWLSFSRDNSDTIVFFAFFY